LLLLSRDSGACALPLLLLSRDSGACALPLLLLSRNSGAGCSFAARSGDAVRISLSACDA